MGLRDRLLGKRTPEDAFAAEVEVLARELLPVSRVRRIDRLTLELTIETRAVFEVRWDDVLRVAGDAMHPEPGSDPPRWRVADWPDAAVLEQLRALALPDG